MPNANKYFQEIGRCYYLVRDGYKCNKCNRTVATLIKADTAQRKASQKKKRKRPVLTINCINGDKIHKLDIYNEAIMLRYELLCYPCNHTHKPRNPPLPKVTQATGRTPSREKRDNLEYEPAFHRGLQIFLRDNEEGCHEEILMNSKQFSNGGNRVTCKRYFDSEILTKTNTKGNYQLFPYRCESDHCDGTHVCLAGTTPFTLLSKEFESLKSDWWSEYGMFRNTWKSNQRTIHLQFIELNEYLESHGTLRHYRFP